MILKVLFCLLQNQIEMMRVLYYIGLELGLDDSKRQKASTVGKLRRRKRKSMRLMTKTFKKEINNDINMEKI